MDKTDYAINVSELTKHYYPITAVDGLSLQVPSGRIVGFLGPNGSGKTTSLRMICGLIKPDQGEGQCLGLDLLTQTDQIQKSIGYMPQKFSLYGNMSVAENLNFIAKLYSLPDRAKRVNDIIDQFQLKHRVNQLARTLSGGFQQRLSLACALLHRPKLFAAR